MQLKDLKSPADIKKLTIAEMEDLAAQMRQAVLKRTSDIGGHVGPNLGDIEAIIAMYYVFDAPKDKLVFDVSHQAFAHKMITGRVDGFINPADYDKVGEYTDPKESPEYDLFYAGHTSPSISLSLGLAHGRDLKGEKHNVVAFIGDGALSGGEAFEGLDEAAALDSNFIVIFNDNQMAIAENHGGMYRKLQELRESNGTANDNIFKAFGFDYIYVNDGNSFEDLIRAFQKVKDIDHPVVVHINTMKGEGWPIAEKDKEYWHWSVPFNRENGEPLEQSNAPDISSVTAKWFEDYLKTDPTALAITAATPASFGFESEVRKRLGKNYLDVSIAEQTGVAVASGAAKAGVNPVFFVEGTFLQRAYDQLIEDLAMNEQPAVIVVFDASIYGIPDKTHLGFWDQAMISNIPDLIYLAPTSGNEYIAMLNWAMKQREHSVAIKAPMMGFEIDTPATATDFSAINTFEMRRRGNTVALIGVGDFFPIAEKAADLLKQRGIDATVINPRFVSGLNEKMLRDLEADHKLIVTLEDNSVAGSFGEKVAAFYGLSDMKVKIYGVNKEFRDHYHAAELMKELRIDPSMIADDIADLLK